jgi:hypothetical protein
MKKQRCWFREISGAGRCEGSLVRCHLISKDRLKKEFPKGVCFLDGEWVRVHPKLPEMALNGTFRSLHALLNDPRVFVWGCGGLSGLAGHHGQADGYKLPISRSALPQALEEYAAELGLGWELDRAYGAL